MDKERFERLQKEIENFTNKHTESPEAAKKYLTDAGFYYENGELHKNFKPDQPSFELDGQGNNKPE